MGHLAVSLSRTSPDDIRKEGAHVYNTDKYIYVQYICLSPARGGRMVGGGAEIKAVALSRHADLGAP